MKPTWNNTQQQLSEFIKNFQNWRDEIFNYENTVSEIADSLEMALLIQHIQGDIKSYLLLNHNLSTSNFDDATTKVEE
eukprot:1536544-Amphidinium_carterae.2